MFTTLRNSVAFDEMTVVVLKWWISDSEFTQTWSEELVCGDRNQLPVVVSPSCPRQPPPLKSPQSRHRQKEDVTIILTSPSSCQCTKEKCNCALLKKSKNVFSLNHKYRSTLYISPTFCFFIIKISVWFHLLNDENC